MSDFTGIVVTGHMEAITPPPILLKDGPQDFFKIEEKMDEQERFPEMLENALEIWRAMKNSKRFILAHIYVAYFSKLPF